MIVARLVLVGEVLNILTILKARALQQSTANALDAALLALLPLTAGGQNQMYAAAV